MDRIRRRAVLQGISTTLAASSLRHISRIDTWLQRVTKDGTADPSEPTSQPENVGSVREDIAAFRNSLTTGRKYNFVLHQNPKKRFSRSERGLLRDMFNDMGSIAHKLDWLFMYGSATPDRAILSDAHMAGTNSPNGDSGFYTRFRGKLCHVRTAHGVKDSELETKYSPIRPGSDVVARQGLSPEDDAAGKIERDIVADEFTPWKNSSIIGSVGVFIGHKHGANEKSIRCHSLLMPLTPAMIHFMRLTPSSGIMQNSLFMILQNHLGKISEEGEQMVLQGHSGAPIRAVDENGTDKIGGMLVGGRDEILRAKIPGLEKHMIGFASPPRDVEDALVRAVEPNSFL